MAISIDEQLDDIERDLSRILEALQDAMTIDTASDQAQIADTSAEAISYRIRRIEKRLEALKYKWQIAYTKSKS